MNFIWTATRGSRLAPWRSPYLRWRLETYSGKPAEQVGLKDFIALAWTERRQLGRFAHWVRTMDRYARHDRSE